VGIVTAGSLSLPYMDRAFGRLGHEVLDEETGGAENVDDGNSVRVGEVGRQGRRRRDSVGIVSAGHYFNPSKHGTSL
jgi:hypothetical protein